MARVALLKADLCPVINSTGQLHTKRKAVVTSTIRARTRATRRLQV